MLNPDHVRELWRAEVRQLFRERELGRVRNETLEEAARVAELYIAGGGHPEKVASKIRSLLEPPPRIIRAPNQTE